MARKKQEFTVINYRKNGEIFDPATFVLHLDDYPGVERELLALRDKIIARRKVAE